MEFCPEIRPVITFGCGWGAREIFVLSNDILECLVVIPVNGIFLNCDGGLSVYFSGLRKPTFRQNPKSWVSK